MDKGLDSDLDQGLTIFLAQKTFYAWSDIILTTHSRYTQFGKLALSASAAKLRLTELDRTTSNMDFIFIFHLFQIQYCLDC